MRLLEAGTVVDGFTIHACLHSGEAATLYRVQPADGQTDPGFAMAMKLPCMAVAGGAPPSIRFEIECQMLQMLQGSQVPRFVAAGNVAGQPYLVMEYASGRTLAQQMQTDATPDIAHIASLGSAMARAVHALHQQNTVHLDLNPDHVLFRDDGSAVLLGFGLAYHAHYPDLLADQRRTAVGSPAWMAPEQALGVRGDLRSDIFAMGVMLYQLCTGQLPFGTPPTRTGLRQRLWIGPVPPRKTKALMPAWLQEVVLRCLEPLPARRYPSAAHLAFDLAHPTQVAVTARGRNTRGTGWGTYLKRRFMAAGMRYTPSPLPAQQIEAVPIVMVAVPDRDAADATLHVLGLAAARALGTRPGACLACVTVVAPGPTDPHLTRLHQWAQTLRHPGHQVSCHVLESADVAQALLEYASKHAVSALVMDAATVPIQVAMDAPCTAILVRQTLAVAPRI